MPPEQNPWDLTPIIDDGSGGGVSPPTPTTTEPEFQPDPVEVYNQYINAQIQYQQATGDVAPLPSFTEATQRGYIPEFDDPDFGSTPSRDQLEQRSPAFTGTPLVSLTSGGVDPLVGVSVLQPRDVGPQLTAGSDAGSNFAPSIVEDPNQVIQNRLQQQRIAPAPVFDDTNQRIQNVIQAQQARQQPSAPIPQPRGPTIGTAPAPSLPTIGLATPGVNTGPAQIGGGQAPAPTQQTPITAQQQTFDLPTPQQQGAPALPAVVANTFEAFDPLVDDILQATDVNPATQAFQQRTDRRFNEQNQPIPFAPTVAQAAQTPILQGTFLDPFLPDFIQQGASGLLTGVGVVDNNLRANSPTYRDIGNVVGTGVDALLQFPTEFLNVLQVPGTNAQVGQFAVSAVDGVLNGGQLFFDRIANDGGMFYMPQTLQDTLAAMQEGYTNSIQSYGSLNESLKALPPELRDEANLARLTNYSGPEVYEQTLNEITNREEEVQRLRTLADEAFRNGDALAASRYGYEAERLNSMSALEIVEKNLDPLAEFGYSIVLDPWAAFGLITKGLGLTNRQRFIQGAIDARSVTPEAAEAAVRTQIDNIAVPPTRRQQLQENMQAVNPFAPSTDTQIDQAANTYWRTFASMLGSIDERGTAQRIINAFVDNPAEFVRRVAGDAENPILDQRGRPVQTGYAQIQTDEVLNNLDVVQEAAEDLRNLPSLQGDGQAFNRYELMTDIYHATTEAKKRLLGVVDEVTDRANNLVERVLNDGRIVVDEVDADSNVVRSSEPMNATAAREFVQRNQPDAPAQRNPVQATGDLLNGLVSLQKRFVNETWLFLPRNIIQNATNAFSTAVADNAADKIFAHVRDVDEDILGRFGGIFPETRLQEAVTGEVGARGQGAFRVVENQSLFRHVPVIGRFVAAPIEAGLNLAYGNNSAFNRLPIGEQAFAKKIWYSGFDETLHRAWQGVVDGFQEQVTGLGLQGPQARRFMEHMVEAARQPGARSQEILQAARDYVDGQVVNFSLRDMGIDINDISIEGRRRIYDAFRDGADDTEGLRDELRRIFRDEEARHNQLLAETPMEPGRYVWTQREVAETSADIIDDMRRAVRNTGQEVTSEISQQIEEVAKVFSEVEPQTYRRLISDLVQSGNAIATRLASNLWADAHMLKTQIRKELQEVAQSAVDVQRQFGTGARQTNEAWNRYYTTATQRWGDYATQFQQMADNARRGVNATEAPASNSAWDLVEDYMRLDEERLRADRILSPTSPVTDSDTLQRVITANRQYVDGALARAYGVMQNVPTHRLQDAFDLVTSSELQNGRLGAMARAFVNDALEQLKTQQINLEDYYRIRNRTWHELADAQVVEYNTTQRQLAQMVAEEEAFADLRFNDVFDEEYQVFNRIERDGQVLYEARTADGNVKRFGVPGNGKIPDVPQQVADEYNRRFGEIEQRANQVIERQTESAIEEAAESVRNADAELERLDNERIEADAERRLQELDAERDARIGRERTLEQIRSMRDEIRRRAEEIDARTIDRASVTDEEYAAFIQQQIRDFEEVQQAQRMLNEFIDEFEAGGASPAQQSSFEPAQPVNLADQSRENIAALEETKSQLQSQWDAAAGHVEGLPSLQNLLAIFRTRSQRGGFPDVRIGGVRFEDSPLLGEFAEALIGPGSRAQEVYDWLLSYSGLNDVIDIAQGELRVARRFANREVDEILDIAGEDQLLDPDTIADIRQRGDITRRELLDLIEAQEGIEPGFRQYEFSVPRANLPELFPERDPFDLELRQYRGQNPYEVNPEWNNDWFAVSGEDIGDLYQIQEQLNLNRHAMFGQPFHMGEIGDVRRQRLQRAYNILTNNFDNMLRGGTSQLSEFQGLRLMDVAQDMVGQWSDTLASAVDAGTRQMNEAMLDFGNQRNIDTWMSKIFGYHYWPTYTRWNWMKRTLSKPSLANRYYQYQRAMERENEQSNVPRAQTSTLPIPGTNYRISDPSVLVYPYNLFEFSPYAKPEEANGIFEKAYETAKLYGFSMLPVFSTAALYGMGRGDEVQMGDFHWGIRNLEYAYRWATGGDTLFPERGPFAAADEFEDGRTGREVQNLLASGAIDQETAMLVLEAITQERFSLDAIPEFENLSPQQQQAIDNVLNQARATSAGRRGTTTGLSLLSPLRVSSVPEDENAVRAARAEQRELGFDPATNPAGSQAAVDEFREQPILPGGAPAGEVLGAYYGFLYGPELPEGYNRPAVRLATNQYWEQVNETLDTMNADTAQYIVDNPGASREDVSDFKATYFSDIDEIGEGFPSVRRKFGDSDDNVSFTQNQNPFERAESEINTVVSYEPPGKPEWPGEEATDEQLRVYYDAKLQWEQQRLSYVENVLGQYITGGPQPFGPEGGPQLSPGQDTFFNTRVNETVGVTVQGKYAADVLRAYRLRFASEVEALWSEQRELEQQFDRNLWNERRANVSATFGASSLRLWEQYLELPKNSPERASFRANNPMIRQIQMLAYDPEGYQQAIAQFGNDIFDLAASYPAGKSKDQKDAEARQLFGSDIIALADNSPRGGTKEQWRAYFQSLGDDGADRLRKYFEWNKGQNPERKAWYEAQGQENVDRLFAFFDFTSNRRGVNNDPQPPALGTPEAQALLSQSGTRDPIGGPGAQPVSPDAFPSLADFSVDPTFPQPGGPVVNPVEGFNQPPAVTPQEQLATGALADNGPALDSLTQEQLAAVTAPEREAEATQAAATAATTGATNNAGSTTQSSFGSGGGRGSGGSGGRGSGGGSGATQAAGSQQFRIPPWLVPFVLNFQQWRNANPDGTIEQYQAYVNGIAQQLLSQGFQPAPTQQQGVVQEVPGSTQPQQAVPAVPAQPVRETSQQAASGILGEALSGVAPSFADFLVQNPNATVAEYQAAIQQQLGNQLIQAGPTGAPPLTGAPLGAGVGVNQNGLGPSNNVVPVSGGGLGGPVNGQQQAFVNPVSGNALQGQAVSPFPDYQTFALQNPGATPQQYQQFLVASGVNLQNAGPTGQAPLQGAPLGAGVGLGPGQQVALQRQPLPLGAGVGQGPNIIQQQSPINQGGISPIGQAVSPQLDYQTYLSRINPNGSVQDYQVFLAQQGINLQNAQPTGALPLTGAPLGAGVGLGGQVPDPRLLQQQTVASAQPATNLGVNALDNRVNGTGIVGEAASPLPDYQAFRQQFPQATLQDYQAFLQSQGNFIQAGPTGAPPLRGAPLGAGVGARQQNVIPGVSGNGLAGGGADRGTPVNVGGAIQQQGQVDENGIPEISPEMGALLVQYNQLETRAERVEFLGQNPELAQFISTPNVINVPASGASVATGGTATGFGSTLLPSIASYANNVPSVPKRRFNEFLWTMPKSRFSSG